VNVTERPVEQLAAAFEEAGVRFRHEEPLARYTTVGLGGPAELLAFPASTEEMLSAVRLANEIGVPSRVMGGGSNLLVSDAGVRGVVIHTGAMKIVRFGEGGVIEAEAGAHFPGLVRAAVSRGLRGLEGGVGIPGSMGGVLAMNAGAFDFSVGNWVEHVTVVTPQGERIELPREKIDFRYRTSSFGDNFVVAECRMKLAEDDPRAIRADMDKQMTVRRTSQPVGVKSAGCIFKNPAGESAGRLIDSLGLKGFRVGGARISEVHANFIVHDGKATTLDVLTLIEQVKEKVLQETSVELVEEVRQWS